MELHYHCYRWFIKILFWWRRTPGYVRLKHIQAIKIWGLLGYLGSWLSILCLGCRFKTILGVKSGHSGFGTGLPSDFCPSFFFCLSSHHCPPLGSSNTLRITSDHRVVIEPSGERVPSTRKVSERKEAWRKGRRQCVGKEPWVLEATHYHCGDNGLESRVRGLLAG